MPKSEEIIYEGSDSDSKSKSYNSIELNKFTLAKYYGYESMIAKGTIYMMSPLKKKLIYDEMEEKENSSLK